jgi:hypothetical protein
MITPSEIRDLALTRNISQEHFTATDIEAAQWHYIRGYLGTDLYAEIVGATGSAYDTFTNDYIKPVLAFAVVVNTFERFTSEVSDRGVVQMLSEGATVMDADSRLRTKEEFMKILNILLEKMTTHCDEENESGNALFELYEDMGFDYTGFSVTDSYLNRNVL